MTIHDDNLAGDILLEIFDAYRQLYQHQPNYESLWNGSDGWFKLAHVCLRWRRLVLSSTTRLRVHLLFTPRRSSREPVLSYLPRLPIFVDYCNVSWTEKDENLALAAIEHRSRVHGITLRKPCAGRLLQALIHPILELESFKICSSPLNYRDEPELDIPPTFLLSAPSLRRLTLRDVVPRCLSPLLSSGTALVELALSLKVSRDSLPEAPLIANLQRLSCLRRLKLKLCYSDIAIPDSTPPPATTGDVVPLSKLTDFILWGRAPYVEMLVARLAATSLQHLDAGVESWSSVFLIHISADLSATQNDHGCLGSLSSCA